MISRLAGSFALAALALGAAPQEVLLWPNGAPGSEGKTGAETAVERGDGMRRIAGIHRPSITAYLPPAQTASGSAVLILPGGGHQYL